MNESLSDTQAPVGIESGQRAGANQQFRNLDNLLPYTVAVCLLPLLVLWHQTDALFSPLWYTDPWFYLGYFRNLVNFKRDLFFGSYYGSRMAWVLPGFVVHSVFPPLVANVVLHLTVQLTATLSFFAILRRLAGSRSAFLATMVFSVNPWLWAATGWDYPDGAGIAYSLLAMALLTHAADQPVRKWSLMLAGLAMSGMAYSHIFLGTLMPVVLLYYFGLVFVWRRKVSARMVLNSSLWIGVAFGIATLLLCGVNYLLDGTFWFYAPSVKRAMFMAKDFRFFSSIWRPHELVPWLWPAVFGTGAAILLFIPRWRERASTPNAIGMLLSGVLLLPLAYMGYWQMRGDTILGYHPYVSYLLPLTFLVMGSSFWPAVDKLSGRTYVLFCGIAALILGALWYYPNGYEALHTAAASQKIIAVSACLLAVALFIRERVGGTVLALAGFALFTAASLPQTYLAVGAPLHATWDQYVRVMRARQRIEANRAGAPILFWYDKAEGPTYLEHFALNSSYIAEFSRISENFPQGCGQPVEPGTLIVVTSKKAHSSELAESSLTDCWRPFDVHPVLGSVEPVRYGGEAYTMTMLKAEPTLSTLPPPGNLLRSISLEQVNPGAQGVVLERVSQGLKINTIAGLGAFAARTTLGVDSTSREKLVALVRLRVLRGKIAVSILNAQSNDFVANQLAWPLPEPIDVVLPIPSPPVIGDLIIRNARADPRNSELIVDKIEVRRLP